MKTMKKTIALLVAVSMIVGCVIGATLAWLTSTSGEVTNTFTTSDITVTLEETTGGVKREFKMIPGWTIDKDPKVTVEEGSEDCWLFVKNTEENDLERYISYCTAEGWTRGDGSGEGKNGVPTDCIFRQVKKDDATKTFSIIGYMNGDAFVADKVLVRSTVTKTDMNTLTESTYPKLKFTAYASQLHKNNTDQFSAEEAWNNANSSATPTP